MKEATLTPKTYTYPLSSEDYEELAAECYSDDSDEWEPVFDNNNKPTKSTLMAFYESDNNIGETVTLDEMQEWINSL